MRQDDRKEADQPAANRQVALSVRDATAARPSRDQLTRIP